MNDSSVLSINLTFMVAKVTEYLCQNRLDQKKCHFGPKLLGLPGKLTKHKQLPKKKLF